MRKTEKRGIVSAGLTALAVLLILLCFLSGLTNLTDGYADEGRRRLEEALTRACVACYAAEGFYPPNTEYLEEFYGIQIDRSRYTVRYTSFAENLMPDITVLEK